MSLLLLRNSRSSRSRSTPDAATNTNQHRVDPPGTHSLLSKPPRTNNTNHHPPRTDSPDDDAMVAFRALQNRLWNALQEEDAVTALWCCRATRADWDHHQIALEQQRQLQKRRSLRSLLVRPRSARRSSTQNNATLSRSSLRSVEESVVVPAESAGGEDEPLHPSSSTLNNYTNVLLFRYTSPSDPFPKDNIPDDKLPSRTAQNRRRRSTSNVRHAWMGLLWTRQRMRTPVDPDPNGNEDTEHWTTLLHEAARLGDVALLNHLLQHPAADCNVRNGAGRTALHCVAAGVPRRPPSHRPKGSAPKPMVDDNNNNDDNNNDGERLQAAELILQWSRPTHRHDHPHDTSVAQGVSTNAVDRVWGRTALHYAAERGRFHMCEAIVNPQYSFGTLLTVLDAHGQTPCDVAAQHGHNVLAARLEARALLYVDPYGTDQELLASVVVRQNPTNNSSASCECLGPPWAWFETLTSVQHKRQHRLQHTYAKMQLLLETTLREREWTQRAVAEHAAVSWSKSAKDNYQSDDDDMSIDSSRVESEATSTREDPIVLDLSSFTGLHMGHVEQYLSFHHFDVKKALQVFSQDPIVAFQEAGLALPLLSHANTKSINTMDAAPVLCLICCEEFERDSPAWRTLSMCDHGFCRDCLTAYLAACAATQSTGLVVPCPHHACSTLLTPSEIQDHPCTAVALLNTARDQFVVQAHDLKFCPHPGCTGVVQFRAPSFVASATGENDQIKSEILQLAGAVCTAPLPSSSSDETGSDDGNDGLDPTTTASLLTTYEGVKDPRYFDLLSTEQPRQAHRFCFRCGDPHIHWPITCDDLNEWNQTVTKHVGTVMEDGRGVAGRENVDDVAQKLWIKANTRPCPKCQAPIQKNEGCNHMICSNPHCKHEFCWICRNSWKLHSSATGGFFRCNRWVEESEHKSYDEESPPVNATTASLFGSLEDLTNPRGMSSSYGTAEHETRTARKKSKEMSRFLHHYRRWHAHADSAALERQMAESVSTRLAPVVREVMDLSGSEYVFDGKGLSFIHAAFTELLECRSMLQHSYAFSFLRYKSTSGHWYERMRRHYTEKRTFEQMQSDLELMVEQISDVVARSHIRATQTQIAFLTHVTAGKRKEFSNVMIDALVEEKKEEKAVLKKKERRSKEGVVTELAGGLFGSIVSLGAGGDESVSPSDSDADENVRESLASYLAAVSASHGLLDYASDNDEAISDWACAVCTYVNTGGRRCEMCDSRRAH